MKEVEGNDGASEYQALETSMEEDIHVEAIVGEKASDVAETTTIGIISNRISNSVLNSFNPQPEYQPQPEATLDQTVPETHSDPQPQSSKPRLNLV